MSEHYDKYMTDSLYCPTHYPTYPNTWISGWGDYNDYKIANTI